MVVAESDASVDADAPDGGATTYAFKPNLVGSPWVLTLKPAGLAWEVGHRSGLIRYDRIRRVRLSFRPVTLQSHRFVTEIWSHDSPKIQFASASWRSMIEQERLDESYAKFVTELHRRLATAGGTARFSAGMPAFAFWVGVAVFVGAMVALVGLIMRAVHAGEWVPTALIVGLFAFFGWQIGDFLRRNRPQTYRPDALPPNVLPRGGRC
jgi:hypothetical protein